MAGAAGAERRAFGLFPIGWIILNAIFVYDITVKTGKFEVVKETIARPRRRPAHPGAPHRASPSAPSSRARPGSARRSPSPPRCSSASASSRSPAAGLALIGNTAPVAYGALGTPIITLAKVTGLDRARAVRMAGRQLPLFSLMVPFWLVWAMAGFRGMIGVWPACLVAGALVRDPAVHRVELLRPLARRHRRGRHLHHRDLPVPQDLAAEGGVALRRRARRREGGRAAVRRAAPRRRVRRHSAGEAFMGWMPWIVLSVFVFIWGMPSVKTWLNGIFNPTWEVPLLHNLVLKAPPVREGRPPRGGEVQPQPALRHRHGPAPRRHRRGPVAQARVGDLVKTYLGTLKRVRFSLLTIAAMLALGFTTRYSGLRLDDGARLRLRPAGCSRSSRRSSAGSASRSPAPTPRRTCSSGTSRSCPRSRSA